MTDEIKKTIKEEGDYKAFEYKGYKCRILRPHKLMSKNSNMIFLCGYVLIPKGHLAYGKGYEIDVSVHGGITYAETTLFAQPEKGWWIGFDWKNTHKSKSVKTLKSVVGDFYNWTLPQSVIEDTPSQIPYALSTVSKVNIS